MDANNELLSKYSNAPFELKTKVYAIAHFHHKLTNMDKGITCEEQREFLGDYWKLNAVETVEDISLVTYMQDFLHSICDDLVKENVDVFEQGKSSKDNFAQVILFNTHNLLFDLMSNNQEFKEKTIYQYFEILDKYVKFVIYYIFEHNRYELTKHDGDTFRKFAQLLKDTEQIAGEYSFGQSVEVSKELMEKIFPTLKELDGVIDKAFLGHVFNHIIANFTMYGHMVLQSPIAQVAIDGMNDNHTKQMYLNNIKKFEEEFHSVPETTKKVLATIRDRLEKDLAETSSGCLGMLLLIFVSSLTLLGVGGYGVYELLSNFV